MAKFIVLANSVREGGRCVAGKCPETGEWMRPIPTTGGHSIPESIASNLHLLDLIEIPFSGKRPNPIDRYQIENEYVDNLSWKKIGTVSPADIRKYVENDGPIFHSSKGWVAPAVLDNLPETEWKSLKLIEADVTFHPDPYTKGHWRAMFRDAEGNNLNIKVTDLEACEILNKNGNLDGACILTISLGQAWSPPDGSIAPYCYKLVAGVIRP
jgi:hypothetical protein